VGAKVAWHNGELFPRGGFIVTNLTRPAKRMVQPGTAAQWTKAGKNAVSWMRLPGSKGFTVTSTHGNRRLVEVSGLRDCDLPRRRRWQCLPQKITRPGDAEFRGFCSIQLSISSRPRSADRKTTNK
jgi:hypothetical protein